MNARLLLVSDRLKRTLVCKIDLPVILAIIYQKKVTEALCTVMTLHEHFGEDMGNMNEHGEDSETLPCEAVLDRYLKSNRLISPELGANVRSYYLNLMDSVWQGNLLRVHHLKTLRRLMDEEDIDYGEAFKIIKVLANDILLDYKWERNFFLRYHASFAIDNCINDIIKYLKDTAPVTSFQ